MGCWERRAPPCQDGTTRRMGRKRRSGVDTLVDWPIVASSMDLGGIMSRKCSTGPGRCTKWEEREEEGGGNGIALG